jgi:N-acetylglucosamine repressor
MKSTRTVSNSKDLKVINRIAVLNMIRKHAPVARNELAKLTGLTPPAVTVIVTDFLKGAIVWETGRGDSSGGRRPVMLQLNPTAAYIFAVRIQQGGIVTALLDINANILESHRQKLSTTSPDEVIATIGASFEIIISHLDIRAQGVVWCGVASPGLVNSFEGIVERSSNLNWGKVPLGQMLSERLGGMPVHVENISNAAALAEKMYGSGYGYANLLYINLSFGIGAGIIINHELFGGSRGYAGEIGTVVMPPAAGESATERITFEGKCGVRAVLERVKAETPDSLYMDLGLAKNRIAIEEVLSPPLAETPEIREILTDVGFHIGIKVAELIQIFNTDLVILGGELARAGDLLDTVIQTVATNSLKEMSAAVKIITSTMREDSPLLGVYALVLEKLFHSESWIQAKLQQ